ncbi:MAG: hypothetical protein M3150_00880 [Pseudomonadota bacterium]|nr:hypothetical protein [Pseudomonadota bacterium]
MKQPPEHIGRGRAPTLASTAFACILATAGMQAGAQGVKPPPLPPGSAQVKVQGGMDDNEIKREVRAHHHKGQIRKDITKDDSVGGSSGSDKTNGKDDGKGKKS